MHEDNVIQNKSSEKKKEYLREYYKKNKERIRERNKANYELADKSTLLEKQRKYQRDNREKLNESARKYWSKNIEHMRAKCNEKVKRLKQRKKLDAEMEAFIARLEQEGGEA